MGLLCLGLTHFEEPLPPSFEFWQQFSKLFITELCQTADMSDTSSIDALKYPREEMNEIIAKAPFMCGIEYLNEETARTLWDRLTAALKSELTAFNGHLSDYLSAYHTAWNSIGRVCFHYCFLYIERLKKVLFLRS